jgi:uncharacterized protein (TIGR02270 family)
MQVNRTVVERHVEDIAFLWARRRDVLQTAQLTHSERIQLESRLEAHLEGALLAGEVGQRGALAQLEEGAVIGAIFAAVALTLAHADPRPLERILAAAYDQDAASEVVSAIGRSSLTSVEPILLRWATGSDEWLLSVAISGFAAHRRSIEGILRRGLRARVPAARSAAARAAREMGAVEHAAALGELLSDHEPTARFEAARALARFGDARAEVRDALTVAGESGQPTSVEAVAALVRLTPADAPALFRRWVGQTSMRRLALSVAATQGSTALVEPLIVLMTEDVFARSAGEALRAITGVDLALSKLARPAPAHVTGDPTDDPDDFCVELPPDYALPFPSVHAVSEWWRVEEDRFSPGLRYLAGRPIGTMDGPPAPDHIDTLRSLVRTGRPRHQTMAARALAQVHPGLPTIETHAFSTRTHRLPGWDAWGDEVV